jgi:LysM repeat protein
MKKIHLFLLLGAFFSSCTPIKSSSKDEKVQIEISLHEVQINLDDLRHDLSCFKTDMQILDSKINSQENQMESIKQKQISQSLAKIDGLLEKIKKLENKMLGFEKNQNKSVAKVENLSLHSKEVISTLTQYKEKISEIEGVASSQAKRLDEVQNLKTILDKVAVSLKLNADGFCSYKVKGGDSLEKIAKTNKITVEKLKKINGLDQDLIVIGQDLKIPKQF